MAYLIAYLATVNGVTMLTYAYDKHAATQRKRRVRERTLHLLALLGGSPAALVAQWLFRHKTVKRSFRTVFVGIVLVQIIFLGYFFTR
ncbi:MAG: hypothetical protein Kow00105_10600 [Phycisphaeraceae bacterium]